LASTNFKQKNGQKTWGYREQGGFSPTIKLGALPKIVKDTKGLMAKRGQEKGVQTLVEPRECKEAVSLESHQKLE